MRGRSWSVWRSRSGTSSRQAPEGVSGGRSGMMGARQRRRPKPPKVQGRRSFRALWAPTDDLRGGMSSFRPSRAAHAAVVGGTPPNPRAARFDRDACGIGLGADIEARAGRALLDSALVVL